MEGYKNIVIDDKINILKQLHIWRKMSKDEKDVFRHCQSEFYADRLMRSLRQKYLN